MNRFATVPLFSLVATGLALSLSADCDAQSNSGKWVAVTARESHQQYYGEGRRAILETGGVYLRDSHGSVYEETRFLPATGIAPHLSAFLFDSSRGVTYAIDLTGKRVQALRPRGQRDQPEEFHRFLASDPPTAEMFYLARRGDKPLGRKKISGVECVGFRIGSSRYRYSEVWFAPSLNFLAVRIAVYREDSEIVTTLRDIEVGEEADAKFFRIPEGFQVVP
jgi:hypothetical protein